MMSPSEFALRLLSGTAGEVVGKVFVVSVFLQ